MVAVGVTEDRTEMPMKLKIQHLMDATLVISQIIREERPMPQKGKYRFARMHDKLNREFLIINARRDEMIKAYDHHPMVPNPEFAAAVTPTEANPTPTEKDAVKHLDDGTTQIIPKTIPSKEWSVPLDKLEEFTKAWMEIGEEEIEVDVQPIPLEQLCFADPNANGSINGHEFIVLGELVAE